MAITYLDDEQQTPAQSTGGRGITYLPDEPGELESFGRGAVNNLPFGGQLGALGTEALGGAGDYSSGLKEWNQKAAQAKEANPAYYGAGAVTGAVAPAFIPGVGEALKAAPLLGNAAMGAGYALGNEDLTKNLGQNVEKGLGGAALGGALGAAGEAVGSRLGANSQIGDRVAARTTAQALDINPLAMRKLAEKMGTSPEQAVLDLGTQANQLIPNLVEPMDSANTKFSKVLDAHDAAGKEIGKIVDAVSEGTRTLPEAQETINALKMAAKNYYQVDGGDLALQKTAERLEALQDAGKLDFDRLHQVKSAIGKGFGKTEVPAGTEEIYGILNDGIDKVLDRAAVEDPTIGTQLAQLRKAYTVTSRLLPAMSRTAAREVAGSSLGGGVLSKAIPSAIGGAIGGLPGALLGGGAKYVQEAVAPDLGKNLAFNAMNAMRGSRLPGRLGQASLNELNDFLASKYAHKGANE